jgi:hypothetical protein
MEARVMYKTINKLSSKRLYAQNSNKLYDYDFRGSSTIGNAFPGLEQNIYKVSGTMHWAHVHGIKYRN